MLWIQNFGSERFRQKVVFHAIHQSHVAVQIFVNDIVHGLIFGNKGNIPQALHLIQLGPQGIAVPFRRLQINEHDDFILFADEFYDVVHVDAEEYREADNQKAGDERSYRGDCHHAVVP